MTEAEWLECRDPFALIAAIPQVSQRKGKLFVVGCCRQQTSVFQNRLNRKALLAVEQNADGLISNEELKASSGNGPWGYRIATACSSTPPVPMFVILTNGLFNEENKTQEIQCRLVREIFGNPFRPVTIDPAWLTPTVAALAQAIYDERAFDRLPILGDALEDAGCNNTDILNHCRQPGVHVRGCWCVDLVLGKQ